MKESESKLVYSFAKSNEEEYQINLRKYRGKIYTDIRLWFKAKENQALVPSKKGISLGVDHIPELRKGFERVSLAIEKLKASEEILQV